MTEYLILFVLLAVSLVILFLLIRVLLQVKRVEDRGEGNVVEPQPGEGASEAVLDDIEEEGALEEAPQ
jgi:hypothetical protein